MRSTRRLMKTTCRIVDFWPGWGKCSGHDASRTGVCRLSRGSTCNSEVIRKPVHTVASRSRSRRAVMKRRAIRGRESVQHKMDMTDLNHGSTGFCRALIVLAVPAISPMPGVGAFNHPVWLQRDEATCARWTRLHFDAPASPMLSHPGVQRMVVILLIRKERDETWTGLGSDEAEQGWGCHPIIETSTGNEHGEQQPQRIDQEMALASLDFVATVIPPLGAPHLGGLNGLTVDARGTGGGLAPRCYTRAFAQGLNHLGPGPVVALLRKVVIDRALGQQIMRQHVPLTPAPVQKTKRVEDLPHVDLTRVPAAWTRLGSREQRYH